MAPHDDDDDHCPAEEPHPHRSRDLGFYIVLFCAVIPLWSVPPLSWAFVLYSLHTGAIWTYAWRGTTLFTMALVEVFFSVYHYNVSRFVSGPSPIGAGNLVELQAAFKRVLQAGLASLPEEGFDEETLNVDRPGSPNESIDKLEPHDARAVDFRNSLRTWFGKVPWSHIHRKEMHAWLYWSIFNAHLPALHLIPAPHTKVLSEALEMIERRSGKPIPEGSNPAAAPLLLTLDPVNVAWRPFGWYAFVGAGNTLMRHWFTSHWGWGMQHGAKDGLEYLLRVPRGWDARTGPAPVVFLHGLGLGLLQYFPIISHLLRELSDAPLLIPLQPHISQQVFHPHFLAPKGRKETAETLRALLVELGWASDEGKVDEEDVEVEVESPGSKGKGITMLSHSNGSYAHAWMLKAHPNLVARSCFVDPVTFCSWEGDVCYNFLYQRCTTGLQLVMRYFVGTEIGVANLLQRHFDWSSNSLWYEEIPHARNPARAKFFLGGNDAILAADRVKKYLTSHGVRKGLWYDPAGTHGSALAGGSAGFQELMRWLKEPGQ
ncbi:hypothetical protein BV25DRAFT_1873699 [Artomyces pyxidatus]|uniref:Uncharacterized protein n=1 Tax=Artomyces pyxidatus TaxID=48021 RepID=A0ACB8TJL4_9AGAM|nr:hypothetical protein BV25DRAFT_1873699 [Artomyces pyxidatus]